MRPIDGEDLLRKICGDSCGCEPSDCGYIDEYRKERCKAGQYVEKQPTVDAIPIEPLAVWLTGYHVSPPEYALWETGAYDEIDPESVVFTPNQIAIAWVYHLRKLMESGLIG